MRFFIESEYGLSTRRLSAFGHSVFDIHQIGLTASVTRRRRTVTHSAGLGSLAGLCQKNSWANWNLSASRINSSYWYSALVGVPRFHVPPMSTTKLPVGLRMR